jgi:hypothetical protein
VAAQPERNDCDEQEQGEGGEDGEQGALHRWALNPWRCAVVAPGLIAWGRGVVDAEPAEVEGLGDYEGREGRVDPVAGGEHAGDDPYPDEDHADDDRVADGILPGGGRGDGGAEAVEGNDVSEEEEREEEKSAVEPAGGEGGDDQDEAEGEGEEEGAEVAGAAGEAEGAGLFVVGVIVHRTSAHELHTDHGTRCLPMER